MFIATGYIYIVVGHWDQVTGMCMGNSSNMKGKTDTWQSYALKR